ncbi:MAG: response regulator transcription factor [Pyrinomonadaceae bacterium]
MHERKKILVVEDDDVTRELLFMMLDREGYDVSTAPDGMKGYSAALSIRPDLIISDVNMPSSDGVHMVRRVRDTAEIAKTPILITTGFGTGMAVLSLTQGADAYEPKPFEPANLLITVRRLLASGPEQ